MEQEDSPIESEQAKPKRNGFIAAFIPKGDYFFTPIILNINFLVFFIMIASGVSPWLPTAEELRTWGANFRPDVINHGQFWRMFTSMFLHCGILHIASNMFALYQIGRMLEQFVGKWRFLALYLMAGLGGSAVSLWWHPDSVGAGASGAIFGLFGVLAALLTTDIIDQNIRKKMLRSITSVIVLNLLIGLNGFIDNSAHIGGLLTGAMGGYLIYFDLKSWYYSRVKKYTGIIISGFLTAGIIIFFWIITPKTAYTSPDDLLKKFDAEDSKAISFAKTIDSTTVLTQQQVQNQMITPWKNCLAITDTILKLSISDEGQYITEQLQTYSQMRIEASQFLSRSLKENNPELKDSTIILNHQADSVMKAVNEYAAKKKK
jgi:rhomboid protease GluP